MLKIKKPYILCWRYDKDIWGSISIKHKWVNFCWFKLHSNPSLLFKKKIKKKLLTNLSWRLLVKNFKFLNFSFEIIKWMKKWKNKKLKNRMWFFFLSKIIWIFYGNLTWKKFIKYCKLCLAKKILAFQHFLFLFEFRIPMFLYWIGLAPSLFCAINWMKSGFVTINNKICWDSKKILKLYDFITLNSKIRTTISIHLIKLFFYASWSARWRKCQSSRILEDFSLINRAHFLALPNYVYIDLWNFSIYWWKIPTFINFKYYFPVALMNIVKYVTI